MWFKDIPIRTKLMRFMLLITTVVLVVTCSTFFVYEYFAFRKSAIENLSTIGRMVASNTTAALAFQDEHGAMEILNTLKGEPQIIQAGVYDREGMLFAHFPDTATTLPTTSGKLGFKFSNQSIQGFLPIQEGQDVLGTLYLRSNLEKFYSRITIYGIITLLVILAAIFLAYLVSKIFNNSISYPIQNLAATAKVVSDHHDYSIRARKFGNDELGTLTDAFNQMLDQIERQNDELNEFNKTLEERVEKRTVELEQLNKELESFSYSISHDLRAPIRAIQGYARIFEEDFSDKVGPEGNRLIKVIIDNGIKMGTLIDDLLTFSRLGRKELTKTTVNMENMAREICADFVQQEKGRSIEFQIGHLPQAEAEPTSIQQVWVNLISNAVKYSRYVSQTIITIRAQEEGNEIIYSVADNGAGFDMEYYNKLFGVFQRLHSNEEFEGTGVGLAIVQRVVNKHGGRVWATSKPDDGATFYFSLPKG